MAIAAGGFQTRRTTGARLGRGSAVLRHPGRPAGRAGKPDAWPDGPVLLHWIDDLGLEQLDVADCMEADAAETVAAYLGESTIDWDQIIGWIRLADVPL